MLQNLSSAAVVIGALKVNCRVFPQLQSLSLLDRHLINCKEGSILLL